MTIILDFHYQLSVVLMIPRLWELDVSMMEMMFYMSVDNVEFSLMCAYGTEKLFVFSFLFLLK